MKKSSQLLFYLLLALLFISMFRLFSEPPTEDIPYSTFKTLLAEKKVKDLVITRDHIRGTRAGQRGRKGKDLRRRPRRGQRPRKEPRCRGISYRGEISDNWLRDFLLTWILPLVVLMLIWSFVFRRMGAGRTGRDVHELRQVARQDLRRERRQGHVQRRGRRGRGQGRAHGDHRVPPPPGQVHQARRPHPQGRAAGRAPGNGQDAPVEGRGRRGQGAVLFHVRLGVRRDVRRRRRVARARPVPAGRAEGALHHLHRRARRPRPARGAWAWRARTRSGSRP